MGAEAENTVSVTWGGGTTRSGRRFGGGRARMAWPARSAARTAVRQQAPAGPAADHVPSPGYHGLLSCVDAESVPAPAYA